MNFDHVKPRLTVHQPAARHIGKRSPADAPLLIRRDGKTSVRRAAFAQLDLRKDDHFALSGNQVNLCAGNAVIARKDRKPLPSQVLLRADFAQRAAGMRIHLHRHFLK